MKSRIFLPLAVAASLLLAGCATQTKEQLASARSAGVSPALMHKLQHWGCLSPADIVELKRRHVNDAVALRQLDRAGVDYVVDKFALRQLRSAGVSPTVIAAVISAGRRFEDEFHHGGGWYGPWGYDPFYYDLGWPYPRHYYAPGPVGGGAPGGPGGGGPHGPAGVGPHAPHP